MADMWNPMSGPAYVPGGAGSFAPSPAAQFEAEPPNGPDEVKEREGGWAKVQAFMQNPDIRMGLLRMGLQMMQPIPVNQTPAGHLANALGSSVDYLGAIQQSRLAQEQLQARTQATRAATEQTQAETRQMIPARVGALEAATKQTQFQTRRGEALLPKELDQKVKELALLEWQVKDAPTRSMMLDTQRKKEELDLLLKEMYGSEAAGMKIALDKAHAEYYGALGETTRALGDKYKQEGDKGKGWTIKNVSRDPETGDVNITSGHADGRMRVVTVTPAKSLADAKSQAKRDVSAMSKEEFNSQFPGMSKEQAIDELAKKSMRERTYIRDLDASGVPVTRGGQTESPTAPPIQPQDTVAVPPALADKPDGTIVPDDKGQWWVKRGKVMKPATDADKSAAQPKSKPAATTAPAPETPIRDAPPGVSPDVAKRYTTTATRGSPARFDFDKYDADMKELQSLVDQVESGSLNQSVAIGRIKILSHKLGQPEPILQLKPKPTEQPKPEPKAEAKPAKFSMNVRRGADGKFAGFDVEEV